MISSKIVNFDRTEAGLSSKLGRISPAVQWFYQNQSICTEYKFYSEVALAKKNIFLVQKLTKLEHFKENLSNYSKKVSQIQNINF